MAIDIVLDPPVNETSYAMQEAVENNATKKFRNLFHLLLISGYLEGHTFDSYFPNTIDEAWERRPPGNTYAQKLERIRSPYLLIFALSSNTLKQFGFEVSVNRVGPSELARVRTTEIFRNQKANIQPPFKRR